jgi:putative two-component system response regulator
MNEKEQWNMYHGALLHDIGKVGIPDSLLQKRGKLDDVEMMQMRSHVQIGARLLEGSNDELLRTAHTIALTHHERWDGSGYPAGLIAKEIPIEGRIVAVCDVFDALLSERYYKSAWTLDVVLQYIRARSGTEFDPQVVDALLTCLPEILASRSNSQSSIRPGVAPTVVDPNVRRAA